MALKTAQEDPCILLRHVATLLRLPLATTSIALHFLHQYKRNANTPLLEAKDLAAACLFAACKVDEVSVSTNHLINTVHILYASGGAHKQAGAQSIQAVELAQSKNQQASAHEGIAKEHPQEHAGDSVVQEAPVVSQEAGAAIQQQAAAPSPPPPPSSGLSASGTAALVADDYYRAKQALITAEQVLLRVLHFQLDIQVPHKPLLHYCSTLRLTQQQSAAAVRLMNDVMTLTDMCLDHSTALLAAGVLHVVLLMLDVRVDGVDDVAQLWPLLGLKGAEVLAVAERVAGLL